jgi:hypothetical protein
VRRLAALCLAALAGTASAQCRQADDGLQSVTVEPSSATVKNGRLQPFVAVATWNDGRIANVTAGASWSSNATTVATVGASTGMAVAASAGSATIQASYGGLSDTGALSVTPGNVYYVAATGGSDGAAGTSAAPWATFAHAFAAMAGGDTLIVKNGTYTQALYAPPSGTAGAYTAIRAESIGGAVLDTRSGGRVLETAGASYVAVEGFWFRGETYITGDHLKIFRSGFDGGPTSDNNAQVVITASYFLCEECWSWGDGGRYKFLVYLSDNVIIRSSVSRFDYYGDPTWKVQCAPFTFYDSTNWLLQNSIAIDSVPTNGETIYGGSWLENNSNLNRIGKIQNSIVLNVDGWGAKDPKLGYGGANPSNHTYENNVYWGDEGGVDFYDWGSSTVAMSHMTIGASSGDGLWFEGNVGTVSMTNSIITGSGGAGVSGGNLTPSYSLFYDNAGGNGTTGTNALTSNPQFQYITRIEAGSPAKGSGSGGSDRGANVLYRYGTPGTLYGETGYDQATSVPLWPFPSESLIKSNMASYSGPGPAGARGFAASGTGLYGGPITLTSYIWEYLGNACPAGVCQ